MELWQQILAFTLTPVMIVSVLAYLFKSLLKSSLDKDLERYKSELKSGLDKDLETFKSVLANQQFEFQKRFSVIHEKRAEVLGELYSRLYRLERELADLTNRIQWNDGRTPQDKKISTQSASKDFIDYYLTKKIYLDESLCKQIEEVHQVLHESWSAFDTSQSEKDHQDDRFGLRRHSSDLVREKFPPLKKQLEERFRKELGSIEGQ